MEARWLHVFVAVLTAMSQVSWNGATEWRPQKMFYDEVYASAQRIYVYYASRDFSCPYTYCMLHNCTC